MTRRLFLALATLWTGLAAGCNPVKHGPPVQRGPCPNCKGAGKINCLGCDGTGISTTFTPSGGGLSGPSLKSERKTCQTCQGAGSIKCGWCNGTGKL